MGNPKERQLLSHFFFLGSLRKVMKFLTSYESEKSIFLFSVWKTKLNTGDAIGIVSDFSSIPSLSKSK